MKRNTALKWIGWLGTFGLALFTPLYRELNIQALKAVATYQYEFPLPTNMQQLGEFAQAHRDARDIAVLIVLGVLVVLAVLIGEILVGLFGKPEANKPTL